MLTIDYIGRTGNNLYQYSLARILCEKNNLKLGTKWTGQLFEANEPEGGECGSGEEILVKDTERDDHSRPFLDADYRGKNVLLRGFFQNVAIYNPYRDKIKTFWKLDKVEKNSKDVVAHLRLTDYYWHYNMAVISPAWYKTILQRIGFNKRKQKLYLVVEPHPTNEKYLRQFNPYDPVIVSGSPKSDFDFIRSFDTILCSNSTFSWWATFLSEAKSIFTFAPWMKKNPLNLAHINGAKAVDGQFINDPVLARYDWNYYWKK
jgi:hypothetical protein